MLENSEPARFKYGIAQDLLLGFFSESSGVAKFLRAANHLFRTA